jgi:tryptophan-rich sensory protein
MFVKFLAKLKSEFKWNYIFIPLVTVLVMLLGSYVTQGGMSWYDAELVKPSLNPPKWVFPIAWNVIFLLTTFSALIIWNTFPHEAAGLKRLMNVLFHREDEEALRFRLIFWFFSLNAVLNVFWSWLFFSKRWILGAFIEMIFLQVTIWAIIFLSYKKNRGAALLLLPYAAWVLFATFLTWQIYALN